MPASNIREAMMKCIRSSIALGASLLWLVTAAPPALADDSQPAKAAAENSPEIYRQGDNFVVAVYHSDGSAVLAVVEPARAKRHRSRKQATPSITELMKTGRVKYTIRLVPADTPEAKADIPAGLALDRPQDAPNKDSEKKLSSKLSRKQKSDLIRRIRVTTHSLDTAGKSQTRSR
jgi:hypothetical protein